MNIKQQLFFDRNIAKPCAFLLNFLVRITGKILNIDHSLKKEFKTIAVCKFKGMGSIIQSTPMLKAIRNRFPHSEIIFVSTMANKKLLEKITLIDTIITVDDSGFKSFIISSISSIFRLIRKRPEIYLDLEIYSDYSTIFTTFTLSKNRIGFYLRSSSFRMGIYTHMMFFNTNVTLSRVYLQLADLIGCDTTNSELYPLHNNISILPKPQKEYIVMNPNASDLRLERRWGQENYIQLINLILKEFPYYDILLIGSRGEWEYTELISSKVKSENVKNIAGATSIDELITVIARARLMISNDTGPMHIAFSTKTPLICLFGPCSPEQYELHEQVHVMYKKVYCSPCVHDFVIPPCKGNNICMKLITTDEVFNKMTQVMAGNDDRNQQKKSEFIYRDGDNSIGQVIR